jgi:hypothetical protein
MDLHAKAANTRRQLSKRVVEERWTLTEAAAAAESARCPRNSANPHIAALSVCDEVTLMAGRIAPGRSGIAHRRVLLRTREHWRIIARPP